MPDIGLLDRMLMAAAPSLAYRRLRARAACELMLETRRYDAARRDRLTAGWNAPLSSATEEVLANLQLVRNRSRDLHRNNPYIASAGRVLVANLIGTGIAPRWNGDNEKAKERAAELWKAWAETTEIDADGRNNWAGILALAVRTMVESGSVLIRRRWRRSEDELTLPFQLEVLEPDHLAVDKDQELDNGRILGGVQFDLLGRRVAYHLRKVHPGDRRSTWISVPVSAENVIHMFRAERPGQVDGVPFGVAAFTRARDLGEYELAELLRAKCASSWVAFITKNDPDSVPAKATTAPQNSVQPLEPGMMEYLEPGESVVLGQPPTTNGFEPYVRSTLRTVAQAFGISYESLSGDLSGTNFSSGRMGWLEMQRNLTAIRRTVLIPQLCDRVWQWVLDAAMDEQLRSLNVRWSEPRREMIDPTKETEGLRRLVEAGFDSRASIVAQLGRDVEEVDQEQRKDAEREAELGLSYRGNQPSAVLQVQNDSA